MTRTHDEDQDRMQESAPRLTRRGFTGVLLAAIGGVGLALVRRFDFRPAPAARHDMIGLRQMGAGYMGSYPQPSSRKEHQ